MKEEKIARDTQCQDTPGARQRRSSVLIAVLIIFLGITFLFNNFGVLPWSSWDLIWKFWPVVLILAGLQISFSRCWMADLLITVIGLSVITFILMLALSSSNPDLNIFLGEKLRWWSPQMVNQLAPREQDLIIPQDFQWEI